MLELVVCRVRFARVSCPRLRFGLAQVQISRHSFENLTPRKKTRFRKFPGKSDLRRRSKPTADRRRPPTADLLKFPGKADLLKLMFGEQQISTLADAIRAALMLRYNDRMVG